MKMISRQEALTTGLNRYFTGKPCVNGHIAERNAKGRACCQCNIEKIRALYAKDIAETRRKWREDGEKKRKKDPKKNREMSRKYMRDHRARKTPEENRETWRKDYRKAKEVNPERVRLQNHIWRARKRADGGKVKVTDIKAIFAKQRGLCAYNFCMKSLKKEYHIDHIYPLSLGGSNTKRNIQLLCPHCNCIKSNKDPMDFAREKGLLL